MTDEVRGRLSPEVPAGFAPVATATRRLHVPRQTSWNCIRTGDLESCHVTHGCERVLNVWLPEASGSLLEHLATDDEEN